MQSSTQTQALNHGGNRRDVRCQVIFILVLNSCTYIVVQKKKRKEKISQYAICYVVTMGTHDIHYSNKKTKSSLKIDSKLQFGKVDFVQDI